MQNINKEQERMLKKSMRAGIIHELYKNRVISEQEYKILISKN